MPTANALKSSRTEPDRVVVVKPYLVSPQEWKVGVLILAFVACLRVTFIWNGFSSPAKAPWTESFQFSETKEAVMSKLENYCRIDATVLCPDDFTTTCLRSHVDPSLTILWGDNDIMNKVFELWSQYPNKWWNVTTIYDAEIDKELSQKSIGDNSISKTMADPETKQILHLFIYTIAELYQQILTGEFVEISYPLEANRLIRYYFLYVLDMFDKNSQKTTTMTTNDVIKQVWTKGELFVVMRFAIQFVQDHEVHPIIFQQVQPAPDYSKRKPVALGESFNNIFLPRATQVIAELEEKYSDSGHPVGEQSTINDYTQELIPTQQQQQQQQQPLFRPHDKNTCMYKHYYATDDNDLSDGLITQQCRRGMKEGAKVFPYLPTEVDCKICEDTTRYAYFGFLNSFSLLLSWLLADSKESHRKRVKKRRQMLQEELEDPQLRVVLEGKFPPNRREAAIAKIEEIVANWDSNAIAVSLVRLKVQTFRKLVLGWTGVLVFLLYWTWQKRSNCEFGLYLDNIFVAVLVFVVSYSFPRTLEEEETPNEDVGTVETLDCQPISWYSLQEFLPTMPLP